MVLFKILAYCTDLLKQVLEQCPEEERQKRSGKVETLVADVITVVQLATSERRQQQAVHHVAHEVGLLGLTVVRDADMRQHLLLEDLASVLDALFLRHTGLSATRADEV